VSIKNHSATRSVNEKGLVARATGPFSQKGSESRLRLSAYPLYDLSSYDLSSRQEYLSPNDRFGRKADIRLVGDEWLVWRKAVIPLDGQCAPR
jgi:hypothetical protein